MAENVDPGHLLPDEVWAAVVADAERQAQRIAAGEAAPEAPAHLLGAERYGTGALPLSGVVTAARHGGGRQGPTFGVIHSAETPLRAGFAASIARMFATTTQDKSCHYMTDPAETWGVLDDLLVAWHVGNGNPNSVALEQSGMAAMTRAQWLVPDGYAQMNRNAAVMRACRDRYGIGLYMMTDAQLLAAHRRQIVGGWATHDQCRRVLGGTTHTDPGGGFPLDVQMALANGGAGTTEDTELDAEQNRKVDQTYRIVCALAGVLVAPKAPNELLIPDQVAMATIGGPGMVTETGSAQALGPVMAELFVNSRNTLRALSTITAQLGKLEGLDVDEAELARQLAPVLGPLLPHVLAELSTEQVQQIADATADVLSGRLARPVTASRPLELEAAPFPYDGTADESAARLDV